MTEQPYPSSQNTIQAFWLYLQQAGIQDDIIACFYPVQPYNVPNQQYTSIRAWLPGVLSNGIYLGNNIPGVCSHIDYKINNYQNLIGNAGPNSQSAIGWQCKLDLFIALGQFYNC